MFGLQNTAMRTFLTLLMLLVGSTLWAQQANYLISIHSDGNNWHPRAFFASNGDQILVGSVDTNADSLIITVNGKNAVPPILLNGDYGYAIRVDSTGQIKWVKTMGTRIGGVTEDDAGNLIFLAYGADSDPDPAAGQQMQTVDGSQWQLFKWDANFNVVKFVAPQKLADPNTQVGKSDATILRKAPNGDIYIAGAMNQENNRRGFTDFDPGPAVDSIVIDRDYLFVSCLDKNLNYKWTRTFPGGGGISYLGSTLNLLVDDQNRVTITLASHGNTDVDPSKNVVLAGTDRMRNVILCRYHNNGSLDKTAWVSSFSIANHQSTLLKNGDIVLSAPFSISTQFIQGNRDTIKHQGNIRRKRDVMIHMDKNLQHIWSDTFPETPYSLTQFPELMPFYNPTQNGLSVIRQFTGQSSNLELKGGAPRIEKGSAPIQLGQTDYNHQLDFVKHYEYGKNNSNGLYLHRAAANDHHFMLTAFAQSDFSIDSLKKPAFPGASYDAVFILFRHAPKGPGIGIQENQLTDQQPRVYPNPVIQGQNLNIQFKQPFTGQVELVHLSGVKVHSLYVEQQQQTVFPVQDLQAGMYFLITRNENKQQVQRIIIQ